MNSNHCSDLGSGSRKRRYDESRRETQYSRFSVHFKLTPLTCFAFLLLHSGAMGKYQVAAISFHSPSLQSSVSSAFIPTQSRLQTHRLATAIASTETPSKSAKKKANDKKEYKSRATFVGDSTTSLELDAPMELVQEFLQSDSSNAYLLGTDDIKCQEDELLNDGSPLFECKQPILEFMGLKLQPIFQHKLHRKPNQVTASIEEGSRAEIVEHSKHPAKRVISSLVNDATFLGESVVTVHPSQQQQQLCSSTPDQKCKLSIALSLRLQIPMPRFIPIPPGFNALGSAIVRRTGRIRTKQLLERIKTAYYQHQQEQELQRLGHLGPATRTPSISSFEDNFRRILAIA